MNQNAPAAITTIEPANASRVPAASCCARSAASAVATIATTSSCPISTPTLNENSDQPSARAGRSISRSTLANPNPWMNPNANAIQARTSRPSADQQVVGADVDDAQRDRRLDDTRRRGDDVQRGERQRDAVRDGERAHDQQQATHRAAEQQQADQKEQMIGADQDVMDAGRNEFLHHRQHALASAREIFELPMMGVENRLRGELFAFVKVDEGLVMRIVRKERGIQRDRAGPRVDRIARLDLNGLALGEHFGSGPRRRGENLPIGRELHALADQRHERFAMLCDEKLDREVFQRHRSRARAPRHTCAPQR